MVLLSREPRGPSASASWAPPKPPEPPAPPSLLCQQACHQPSPLVMGDQEWWVLCRPFLSPGFASHSRQGP